MSINILDCTLRDGGYVNDWEFRRSHIISILNHLSEANIDIIECGYLSNKETYNKDKSIFNTLDQIKSILPKNRAKEKYVCMVNYGEYDIQDIDLNNNTSVDGFRVAFHKKDSKEALEFCEELQNKGYDVFVQPMVTINYSDQELLSLIKKVNMFNPFACYIVDSFGVMKRNDLSRLLHLFDHNLNATIKIGYHAHNNLQLAYSNAQKFCEVSTLRTKIVDGSVYGMGRGAGNLNTELFIQFINDNFGGEYNITPLLKIIDESINPIYKEQYWGYSMPHYLSAIYNCHPNYSTYLAEKNTLTVDDLKRVMEKISISKRDTFDKGYVEKLYLDYQTHTYDDTQSLNNLRANIQGRQILIIGPGISINKYLPKIKEYIELNNPVCISINHIPRLLKNDYTFISNIKRFEMLNKKNMESTLIFTSNIKEENNHYIKVNYNDLLISNSTVVDNAGLMCLSLLKKLGFENVMIAGLDGYEYDYLQNYNDQELALKLSKKQIESYNIGMSKELMKFKKEMEINFLTPSIYAF